MVGDLLLCDAGVSVIRALSRVVNVHVVVRGHGCRHLSQLCFKLCLNCRQLVCFLAFASEVLLSCFSGTLVNASLSFLVGLLSDVTLLLLEAFLL